jgi:protein SCO1
LLIKVFLGKKMMKKLCLMAVFLLLCACNPANPPAKLIGTDITGAEFAKELALTDHTGKARTMKDFNGKVVVLFFGYTHCPDVCPTTMSDLKQTMKLLGEQANDVQVLFVTVDPQRDTQAILAQYVPYFDKRFIGLYGSLQQTAEMMGNFKIWYSKVESQTKGEYTIDHSAGLYVFDKKGKVRLYIDNSQKAAQIVSDLKHYL